MPELQDGEEVRIQGSAKDPYILKNVGGVHSCTCPAWRNQSTPIERRTCKHLRQYRGEEAEMERLGGVLPQKANVTRSRAAASSGVIKSSSESVSQSDIGFLLAHSWDTGLDLTGWWMSEKLDGVRAYWDGKKFISRQGNEYMAPDWFVADLPSDIHLDGELWLARKQFQRAVSIVRRQDKNDMWREIKYLVFDAPMVDDVFEARMAHVSETLDSLRPKYAEPHVHERCKSIDHLHEELKRIEALGGEGLMLRKPGSKYEVGRSSTLLKVKSFLDADARVIEHMPGTGKHKDRLGALHVEMADGTRFHVGTGFTDAERESPPSVGSIISFRYQELSDRGVPRFPSFIRMRTDVDDLDGSANGSGVPSKSIGTKSSAFAVPVAARNGSDLSGGSQGAAAGITGAPEAARPAASSAPAKTAATKSGALSGRTAATGSLDGRYFEFVAGTSSKFWEITISGDTVTVRFGKIGTKGMSKPKTFATASAAKRYHDELIDEKVGKGYVEQGGGEDSRSDDNSDDDDWDDGDDE